MAIEVFLVDGPGDGTRFRVNSLDDTVAFSPKPRPFLETDPNNPDWDSFVRVTYYRYDEATSKQLKNVGVPCYIPES